MNCCLSREVYITVKICPFFVRFERLGCFSVWSEKFNIFIKHCYIAFHLPHFWFILDFKSWGGGRGRDPMVVGFYNYLCSQCLSPLMLWVLIPLRWGVLDTTLCEVCQWLAAGLWFSPGTPVSSTNKTDRHDIAEIVLKVVLNT